MKIPFRNEKESMYFQMKKNQEKLKPVKLPKKNGSGKFFNKGNGKRRNFGTPGRKKQYK